jgi:hypothetical protein
VRLLEPKINDSLILKHLSVHNKWKFIPGKKARLLCSDSNLPFPKNWFKCLNKILALFSQSPALESMASTCTASIFFFPSVIKPFSSPTEVNASSSFLCSPLNIHSAASLELHFALFEIAFINESIAPFFIRSEVYLSAHREEGQRMRKPG